MSQRPTVLAFGRQYREFGEAQHDRIAGQILQVAKAPSADDNESDQQPYERDRRKVTGRHALPEMPSQPRREVDAAQEALEKLKAAVRAQAVGREAEREIAVDTGTQSGFSLSHWEWPFGLRGFGFVTSQKARRKARFQAKRRHLSTRRRLFCFSVLSHQG